MDLSNAEININQAMEILLNVSIPSGIPTMLWGQPGLGKTFGLISTFQPEGKKEGDEGWYDVVPVLAGCSEPTDLTGIPFNYQDSYAKYLAPEWAFLASTESHRQGPMIIFMDDIVTAPEQTQAAFYKTVHEKRVGNLTLRDNVHIIAAGNRVDDKSATVPMPLALGNRFMHLYLKPDDEVWHRWAVRNGIHPDVVAYLSFAPGSITTFADAVKSSEVAFATPRTWEVMSKAMFALDASKLRYRDGREKASERDLTFQVGTGIVGQGMALEFTTFVKDTHNLVTPSEIVKDPHRARLPEARELDVLHATLSGCEHYIRNQANWSTDNFKAMLIYGMRIEMTEIGSLFARTVSEVLFNNPLMDGQIRMAVLQSPEWQTMWEKWGEDLHDMGH